MDLKSNIKRIFLFISIFLYELREILWRYPYHAIKIIIKTLPFSAFIFSFLLVYPIILANNYYSQNVLFKKDNIYNEAYLGLISSINPIQDTNNQIEKDIIYLVYSPLYSFDAEGKLTYKLAKGYTVSQDKLSYTFILRDDVYWHDSTEEEIRKFTADDVVFTFSKSPKILEQKIQVKKDSDYRVTFTISQTSAVFLELVNIPIMPKHIWENVEFERWNYYYRAKYPIGTGPYKVTHFEENKKVILSKNVNYWGKSPIIETIEFDIFQNESDLITHIRRNKMDGILDPTLKVEKVIQKEYDNYRLISQPIYRNTKVLFFNSGDNGSTFLQNKNIRKAVVLSIDREDLINQVDIGSKVSYSPIPNNSWAFNPNIDYYEYDLTKSNQILNNLGWGFEESNKYRSKDGIQLDLTVTYLNNDLNNQIVELLKSNLKESGINLVFDPRDYISLSQEIIPKRDYEILLFEVETGLDPDPYNFWYSTKSEGFGLNLAGYKNIQVDMRLETGRTTLDKDKRKKIYYDFLDFWTEDMPSMYLYHPAISYYCNNEFKGIDLSLATIAEERFLNISEWSN